MNSLGVSHKTKSRFFLRWTLVSICALALFFAGCSSAPPKSQGNRDWPKVSGSSQSQSITGDNDPKYPSFVEKFSPAEKGALREAQTYYESGAYDQSLDRLHKLSKFNPKTGETPTYQNLLGLNYLALKRTPEAAIAFQKAAQKSPKDAVQTQYLYYNLATAEYESGQLDQALSTLDEMNPASLNKTNRVKFYVLRSKIYEKKNQPIEGARDLLLASTFASPETAVSFGNALDRHLAAIKEISTLRGLTEEFQESPIADSLFFRLGSLEIVSGSESAGESHLRDLLSRFPQSRFYSQSQEMLRARQKDSPTNPRAIGVLLPLQGKFATYGQKALLGIQLGLRIFNQGENASPYELVFEDAGEDAQQAVRALEKLFFKHHVVGIIGPLLSKGLDQVTQRAQELGVPLVSLSRNEGLRGDWIFPAGLTLRLQAQVMAQFAMQDLHAKRFAIVHPRDKIGEETANAFWDAVEQQGGQIVGIESYSPTERDFRTLIDKLSGLFYKDARMDEINEMTRVREQMQIKTRNRKTEQYYALPPIVDYDAVFIPDEPGISSQIIPTFAYRDVEGVKFLGTSVWNSEEFPAQIQNYGSQTYFLDAFLPRLATKKNRQFVDKFRATFQEDPSTMEAIAYDATRLFEEALDRAGAKASRTDLRDQLKRTSGFDGITGNISYKNGLFSRDLRILTIKNNRIHPLQKLPLGSE